MIQISKSCMLEGGKYYEKKKNNGQGDWRGMGGVEV